MRANELMTSNPACCTASATLREAAQLMCDNDCGEIPVVENNRTKKLVGVITDRDICCRGVAQNRSLSTPVGECMSQPVVSATPESDLDECCRLMEEHMVRRLPVVDGNGCCCGIISQADLAERAPESKAAEVLREVSHRTAGTSSMHA